MFKGLMAALVALISTLQLDRYLTNGRYTDTAMDMLRQIRRAFGFWGALDDLRPVMKGIPWTDLDAEEQRAIAILGAGLSIELCDPVALSRLKRLGLIAGSQLTAAAHELRRRVVLEELSARD